MVYDRQKAEAATTMLLEALGHPKDDPNVMETPQRVAKMFSEILGGYDIDPMKYVKLFPCEHNNMVIVRNVPIYSYCSHHMQPFYGQVTIAYIPNGQVLGLSKLVRIARAYAKRLQLQENLTAEIATFIRNNVPNLGVAVSIKAQHHCMLIRGVRSYGTETVTTELTGLFKEDPKAREEFLLNLSDGVGY